jgi:hypothetical protein
MSIKLLMEVLLERIKELLARNLKLYKNNLYLENARFSCNLTKNYSIISE